MNSRPIDPVERAVRPITLAPYQIEAMGRGRLRVLRLPVSVENSVVHPGQFEGLDFDSGRARRMSNRVELRARCQFESGSVRAVTCAPVFLKRDLFWVRMPGAIPARENSGFTLRITDIDVARLRDIQDADLPGLGAPYVEDDPRDLNSPRAKYRRAWDRHHAQRRQEWKWYANPWVWLVRVTCLDRNVNELLG